MGFSATKSDPSLFTKFTNDITIFKLIYVDDIIITGSSSAAIAHVISSLNNFFCFKGSWFITLFSWHRGYMDI